MKIRRVSLATALSLAVLLSATFVYSESCTIETSCEIAKGIYEENIQHLNKMIALAHSFGGDPLSFQYKENKAQEELNMRITAIFDSHHVKFQDYLAFAGENKTQIDLYLSGKDTLRQEIEGLRAEALALSLEYDQLLTSLRLRETPESEE